MIDYKTEILDAIIKAMDSKIIISRKFDKTNRLLLRTIVERQNSQLNIYIRYGRYSLFDFSYLRTTPLFRQDLKLDLLKDDPNQEIDLIVPQICEFHYKNFSNRGKSGDHTN